MNVGRIAAVHRVHDRHGPANDIGDRSPPAGMDRGHHRTSASRSRIDHQNRLAIGVECDEHGAFSICRQRVGESNLRRTGHGAPPGMPCLRHQHLRAMNLTQGHQSPRLQTRRGAPPLAHCPGIVPVARRDDYYPATKTTPREDALVLRRSLVHRPGEA